MTITAYQVPGMTFDAARLAERRNTIGASEIGAIAGLSKWKCALEVYHEKIGLSDGFAGNEATEWGLRLEDSICTKYGELFGVTLDTSPTLTHPTEPWMSATPDRIVTDRDGNMWGLEAKNKSEYTIDDFGPASTDQVPDDIAAQCHWNLAVHPGDFPYWDVAVLLGGNKFRWFRVMRNKAIEAGLIEIGRRFWFENVLPRVEPKPDNSEALYNYLRRLRGEVDSKPREATLEEVVLLADLKKVQEEKKEVEARERGYKNSLMTLLGDSTDVSSPLGKVSFKASAGSVSWKNVAMDLKPSPELIKEHTSASDRSLRINFKKGA